MIRFESLESIHTYRYRYTIDFYSTDNLSITRVRRISLIDDQKHPNKATAITRLPFNETSPIRYSELESLYKMLILFFLVSCFFPGEEVFGFATSRSPPIKMALSMQSEPKPLVTIGTRGSPLALAQAYETKRLLGLSFPELRGEGAVEIKKIMTKVSEYSSLSLSLEFC